MDVRDHRWSRTALVAALIVGMAASAAVAGAEQADDDPAPAAVRERLADLFASDDVERINFLATTFDEAMTRIYLAVDELLATAGERFDTPGEAAAVAAEVIESFDSHRPRGLAMTFLEDDELVVDGPEEATTLGSLLGTATALVGEHTGPGATPERIRASATALFRAVVLEPDGGLSYLEQYRAHVERVAELSRSDRVRFLEAR